jgi:EAL domain-containing protein (putative c-di-GMP-specific phosphodiesterase class I)
MRELSDKGRFLEEIGRSAQSLVPGESAALLLLDVDDFHFANGSLERGAMQIEKARALVAEEAERNRVTACICEDEFAVFLHGASGAEALDLAEQLIASVETGAAAANAGVVGVSGDRPPASPEALMIAADIALCEARAAGGGRAVQYIGRDRARVSWADRVRRAIAEDRIVVYAQPIFDLREHTVAREELLVRMIDEDGELICPSSFLPAAERSGLTAEIDRLVLAKAVELAGVSRPISVNVSGASLSEPRLIADVRAAVEEGLSPHWLDFEVTETVAISNMTQAQEFGHTVTQMGCGLGLDDFGTGFSSLSYLKALPIQHLKIDLEFVRNLCDSIEDRRMVGAIVQFARALGLETVAEGVEDCATLRLVHELGVDYAQGFHVGEPVAVDQPVALAA